MEDNIAAGIVNIIIQAKDKDVYLLKNDSVLPMQKFRYLTKLGQRSDKNATVSATEFCVVDDSRFILY